MSAEGVRLMNFRAPPRFEVEATLIQHPAVLEAAVVGVPDAEGLIKTKAYRGAARLKTRSMAELKRLEKQNPRAGH
jgi:benzoate-CoA ligase